MRPRAEPLTPPTVAAFDIYFAVLQNLFAHAPGESNLIDCGGRVRRFRVTRRAAFGHRADDLLLRNLCAAKLCDAATVAHDDDARASLDQLFKLGRDHEHAESGLGQFVD